MPPPGPSPGRVTVREILCKTILNRSSLGDYTLNCYTGCAHGCVYCYARFMQRFHPHPEPWGRFVDVKKNAVDALIRQLRRLSPGEVFVSSACDGWQPAEAGYELTRRCCSLLIECGFRLNILTKSSLVLRDFDIFSESRPSSQGHVRLGVTITTLDEEARQVWEPGASSTGERLKILKQARQAGLETSVMFGPLLPFISDTRDSLDDLFRCAADLRIDTIWVDALNPRPMVWPAISNLLNERYPQWRQAYRALLFDPAARADYLSRLRDRVTRSARKYRLLDRLAGCP